MALGQYEQAVKHQKQYLALAKAGGDREAEVQIWPQRRGRGRLFRRLTVTAGQGAKEMLGSWPANATGFALWTMTEEQRKLFFPPAASTSTRDSAGPKIVQLIFFALSPSLPSPFLLGLSRPACDNDHRQLRTALWPTRCAVLGDLKRRLSASRGSCGSPKPRPTSPSSATHSREWVSSRQGQGKIANAVLLRRMYWSRPGCSGKRGASLTVIVCGMQ